MAAEKKKKPSYVAWGLAICFAILLGLAVYVILGVFSEDTPRKKNNVATISLVKPPPPPPPIKEKPPEQQPVQQQQKQEFVPNTPNNQPKGPDNQDNTPAGDKLGLDAEGKAGGDGFGLVGRKGGRSILAGGGGGLGGGTSLLRAYSWYTRIVESEVRKKVLKNLEEQGGIPGGKLQAIVELHISESGSVTGYKIIGSSGNHRMDDAVMKALSSLRMSEAPPEGMPKTMKIRVSSQG